MGNKTRLALTEQEQNTFYIMKIFACISVIAAHINHYVADEGAAAAAITGMWGMFARCGVIIFFILNGMFFRKADSMKLFVKKRFQRLVVPWLLCAGMTYLFKLMLVHKLDTASVKGYVYWLIGKDSWYYYMTVLMVLLLLFQVVKITDALLFVCMGITLVSLGLLTAGIPYISTLYLNPLNWLGFFAFGVLFGKYRLDKYLLERKKLGWAALAVFLLSSVFNIRLGNFTYFNIFMVITELSGALLVLYASDWCSRLDGRWKMVGESTFFIYLTHMQLLQTLSGAIPDGPVKYLLDPILGFCVMLLIAVALYKLLGRGEKGRKLLGFLGISKA